MNLQQTVSQILGHEVSEEGAQEFASKQFGVLATHLRKELKEENSVLKNQLNDIVLWGNVKN